MPRTVLKVLQTAAIPKSQAQDILAALVSRGWLSKSAYVLLPLGQHVILAKYVSG